MKSKNIDDYWRQHGDGQWYITIGQQQHACDDLEPEDHPQVVRGVQGAHELPGNTSRRGKGDEIQKAVQAEDKKDHARQIPGDCGSGSHNPGSPFRSAAIALASCILMSIYLMMYTFEGFRFL